MPEEAFSESNATEQAVTHEIGAQTQEPRQLGEESAQESPLKEKESQTPEGQKPKEQLSRYERTKRERAAFKAQQAEFARQREAFAQERAQFEEQKKPKRDYTLGDLKKYRGEWARDAENGVWRDGYDPAELVKKADKEIAVMEAEAQAQNAGVNFQAEWEQAERELYDAELALERQGGPRAEFMRKGTRMDTKLREIMASAEGNIYRQHPRGIVAAYHRAKMELLETDMKGLQTENSKLKNELQRLTGLTSIDGGTLGQVGNGSRIESLTDFERLSTKDMRKHLARTASRGNTPWF